MLKYSCLRYTCEPNPGLGWFKVAYERFSEKENDHLKMSKFKTNRRFS